MEPAIATEHLSRHFTIGRGRNRRRIEAVAGLDLTVAPGERLAFIGPNGAGKSTSIKMLTGILRPTAGRARVLGLEPWSQRRDLARRIGTLFGQRSQLWAELPPTASFALLGALFGVDGAECRRRQGELGELLEATELFQQPVRTMSLGQRMRCELAASMLHQPELLFLDEPTIGLDLLGKRLFRHLLVRLNTQLGTTVFLTSHDVSDIEHVAERAVVVNQGGVIYDAPVDRMRRRFLSTKRIELRLHGPGDPDAVEVPTTTGAMGDEVGSASSGADAHRDPLGGLSLGPGATVVTDDAETDVLRIDVDTRQQAIDDVLGALLAARLPVVDLSVLDPPLEQIIGDIYAGETS
ncbi:MAG: ATP-binding cassette domain-containing protein [Actinomycetota bacterium]